MSGERSELVRLRAPDHAKHTQDLGVVEDDGTVNLRCSCGVGLTFRPLAPDLPAETTPLPGLPPFKGRR